MKVSATVQLIRLLLKPFRQRNEWKDVLIDCAVVNWCYRNEHENDPQKCLAAVIQQEIQFALDPAISAEARALIERGRNEVLQEAQRGRKDGA